MSLRDRTALDAVYRSVADRRRQFVIAYLRDTPDGTASLDEVADYVVEQEPGAQSPDRGSVLVDLHHTHLPLLDDTGVVDFDRREGTIRYRPDPTIEAMFDNPSFPRTDAGGERTR